MEEWMPAVVYLLKLVVIASEPSAAANCRQQIEQRATRQTPNGSPECIHASGPIN